jgi:hypothetical protein
MVFKLGLEAQKHWRRLQGFELISKGRYWRSFRRWRRTIPTGRLINHFNKDAPGLDTQLLTISRPLSPMSSSGPKVIVQHELGNAESAAHLSSQLVVQRCYEEWPRQIHGKKGSLLLLKGRQLGALNFVERRSRAISGENGCIE